MMYKNFTVGVQKCRSVWKFVLLKEKNWGKNNNKILQCTLVLKIRRCTKNLHSFKNKKIVFISDAKMATFRFLQVGRYKLITLWLTWITVMILQNYFFYYVNHIIYRKSFQIPSQEQKQTTQILYYSNDFSSYENMTMIIQKLIIKKIWKKIHTKMLLWRQCNYWYMIKLKRVDWLI